MQSLSKHLRTITNDCTTLLDRLRSMMTTEHTNLRKAEDVNVIQQEEMASLRTALVDAEERASRGIDRERHLQLLFTEREGVIEELGKRLTESHLQINKWNRMIARISASIEGTDLAAGELVCLLSIITIRSTAINYYILLLLSIIITIYYYYYILLLLITIINH